MRSSEWVAFLYFAVMGALAWARPLPASRRLVITIAAVVTNAAMVASERREQLFRSSRLTASLILVLTA